MHFRGGERKGEGREKGQKLKLMRREEIK